MNQKKVKAIRADLGFDPKAKRTYTKHPKTGVVFSNVERQKYQKAKKQGV